MRDERRLAAFLAFLFGRPSGSAQVIRAAGESMTSTVRALQARDVYGGPGPKPPACDCGALSTEGHRIWCAVTRHEEKQRG